MIILNMISKHIIGHVMFTSCTEHNADPKIWSQSHPGRRITGSSVQILTRANLSYDVTIINPNPHQCPHSSNHCGSLTSHTVQLALNASSCKSSWCRVIHIDNKTAIHTMALINNASVKLSHNKVISESGSIHTLVDLITYIYRTHR